MASIHRQAGNRPGYKLRFRDHHGKQRVLWFGNISKKNANTILRHVSNLVETISRNMNPDIDSLQWANELKGRMRQRLAEWGFVGPQRKNESAIETRLCDAFFKAYIGSRDDLDQKTRVNYQQAADSFVKFVGKNRLLCDITPADVDAWRLWMLRCGRAEATDTMSAVGYSLSTANKHAKRIKTLFGQAVRAKLIGESPAADQKIGGEVNPPTIR